MPPDRHPGQPRRPPLSTTVADGIEREIVERGLQPGTVLPTEVQLMERYGVSRTVVREAARTLVQKGLVEVRAGRGMTVTAVSVEQFARQLTVLLRTGQASLDQLFELRELLEPAIASAAAQSRSAAQVETLAAILQSHDSGEQSADSFLQADLDFHEELARSTGNPFFLLVTTPLQLLLHDTYAQAVRYTAYQDLTRAEHRAMFVAVEAQNARAAATATRVHLRRVRATLHELIADERRSPSSPTSGR